MSKKLAKRLKKELKSSVLEINDAFGDYEVVVPLKDWLKVCTFLHDDEECLLDHFIDLTAVDFPEREAGGEPRFEVLVFLRSSTLGHRLRVKTMVADGEEVPTLIELWSGANWTEREVWDMFGIRFKGHPDMRRILLYEEFEGHPLRKDYPIDKAQPLIEYRVTGENTKLPPFGIEEGQPFPRVNWEERLAGRDEQVSPSLGVQSGQRRMLSDSLIAEKQASELKEGDAG